MVCSGLGWELIDTAPMAIKDLLVQIDSELLDSKSKSFAMRRMTIKQETNDSGG
jgi:hypothetical protein